MRSHLGAIRSHARRHTVRAGAAAQLGEGRSRRRQWPEWRGPEKSFVASHWRSTFSGQQKQPRPTAGHASRGGLRSIKDFVPANKETLLNGRPERDLIFHDEAERPGVEPANRLSVAMRPKDKRVAAEQEQRREGSREIVDDIRAICAPLRRSHRHHHRQAPFLRFGNLAPGPKTNVLV